MHGFEKPPTPIHTATPATPSGVTSRFSRWLQLSICSVLLLLFTQNTFAAQVVLGWDAGSASASAGYILYYGEVSGYYSVALDVGTATTAAISGLYEGRTYYFTVTAYNVDGDESPYSNEVTYTFAEADSTPPTVALTSPVNGASVPKKSTVTIGATASDNIGVTKVEFYVNGQLVCADTTSAYSCVWQVPAALGRTYQLRASAYDAQGNVGQSSTVTVKAQ